MSNDKIWIEHLLGADAQYNILKNIFYIWQYVVHCPCWLPDKYTMAMLLFRYFAIGMFQISIISYDFCLLIRY